MQCIHSIYLLNFFILKENIFENEVLNAWLIYLYSFQLQMEHWNMLTRGTWLFKNGTQLFSCAHNYTSGGFGCYMVFYHDKP